jgi:hypothetical protein
MKKGATGKAAYKPSKFGSFAKLSGVVWAATPNFGR